jgi:hypothetical protein
MLLFLKFTNNEKVNDLIHKIFCFNINKISDSEYSEKLIDYLETSNENDVYYVYKIIGIYIQFYLKSIDINFFKNYVKMGFKTLTEKRENLNYLNTATFLNSFINEIVVGNYKQIIPIICDCFKTIYDLNEKRTWLIIKISCDLLLNVLEKCPSEMKSFSNIILDLVECKETRGEDSFLLRTSPQFLYSPFNINPINIIKNNLLNEDVSKYGLYVRIKILDFFDKNISNFDPDSILNLIENILTTLDNLSSNKSEMQFTSKHRKKLRLSQFLLTLSKIFTCTKFAVENEFKNIENLSKKIFEKVNLNSVRYYLDIFFLKFGLADENFMNYLVERLSDPNAKTHNITSAVTILATILLENKISSIDVYDKVYQIIISLCTSNICNIRGLAQYFMYQLHEKNKNSKDKDNSLSDYFYTYLSKNSQIVKFFNRFNETYKKFTHLIHNNNAENILYKSFDEINCEIMPVDMLKEFKEMAMIMVPLENENVTNPNYS